MIEDVSCHSGWAVGRVDECPAAADCDSLDVFHVTENGWVYDGLEYAVCAEGLTGAGMSIYTAAAFVSNFCEGQPPATTEIIRPESTGERVLQLQVALVGQGYPIGVDGTFGPRTQAAVRDFQARNGLEVDGIAGPRTQAALGIGPGAQGAISAPSASTSTAPAGGSTTTVVVAAGAPAACTAAAIGADVGVTIDEISVCHSGWALGLIESCPAQTICEHADIFHMTDQGWVHDGEFSALCAESLRESGMSSYTAAEFGTYCGEPDPPAQREIITPGSTGDDVTNLQIALVALGYPIAVDGTYGPRTQAAVRDYQAANGLSVDGIAGPATRSSLGI